MGNNKCPWHNKCRNGYEGCWMAEPENCVRFLPTEGTNLTEINGIVETPPDIDYDKFNQYFTNWIEAMGWSFCGSFQKYKGQTMTRFDEIKSKNIDEFVDWLDEVGMYDSSPWMQWWDDNYCSKCEPEVVEDPDTGGEFCNMYCELHDKCKYFKHMDDIPSIKQIIKMWLESEV